MKPLILITNDDGVNARGIHVLSSVAAEFADVVVMAPERDASGTSHSITSTRPVRAKEWKMENGINVYSCDGTPVDCVKLATEHFCPRQPDLVLSGINHGSNSSINVLYSGTLGAVLEACALGFNAIGFSLLHHSHEADFSACLPWVRQVIGNTLKNGLPRGVALNVNIPKLPLEDIRGIRICHAAEAYWSDSFAGRVDPRGVPYWWLTGKFICENPPESSDEWALAHGYVSVVPIHTDFTHYPLIDELKKQYK